MKGRTMPVRRVLQGLLLACAAVAVGCGGARSGLGVDTGRPSGDPFSLPAQVAISGTIVGEQDTALCPAQDDLGSSNLVSPCFTLQNSSGADIVVTFPPRLIFISKSNEVQNGLVLENLVVTVPGSGTRVVRLGLFCLNLHRDPSGVEDQFELGPLTTEPGLKEIAEILTGKDLTGSTVLVQQAVWEVTEENSLSGESRAALQAL